MKVDREHLDTLVGEGWLRRQRHPDADLWIYNYTEKTQYENHWTPETLIARGLIVATDGEVVARPFAKFFNYGTPQAPPLPAEPFTVTEKIDGSLGVLYDLDGEPMIATRGSFTSEQAIEGTRLLREHEIERPPGVTPLFEIVYPANRVVVDYGGERSLTLLAAICHETGRDKPLPRYSGPVVRQHGPVDLDTLAARAEPNREGFVVSFASGVRVKVKFAEYVRLHKIVTGVNARMIWASMRDGDDLATLLTNVPDEIYGWITTTRDEIQRAYDTQLAAATATFEGRPDTAERKALAQYFLASDANPAVLFRMLDGKPFDDLIWKAIRPGAASPGFVNSEQAP